MGRASTERNKKIDAMLNALNNTKKFDQQQLTTMLNSVVPLMTPFEIERMLESVGMDIFDLED